MRRKEAGRCFKCSVGDASEAPSLYCPLHGASASRAPNTPTGGRTLAARAACGTELLLSSPIHGPSARRAGGASHQSRRSGGSTRGPVATRRAAAGRRRQAGAIRQWPMLCATTGGGTERVGVRRCRADRQGARGRGGQGIEGSGQLRTDEAALGARAQHRCGPAWSGGGPDETRNGRLEGGAASRAEQPAAAPGSPFRPSSARRPLRGARLGADHSHGEYRRMLRRAMPSAPTQPAGGSAGAAPLEAAPLPLCRLVEKEGIRRRRLPRPIAAQLRAGLAPPPQRPRLVDGTAPTVRGCISRHCATSTARSPRRGRITRPLQRAPFAKGRFEGEPRVGALRIDVGELRFDVGELRPRSAVRRRRGGTPSCPPRRNAGIEPALDPSIFRANATDAARLPVECWIWPAVAAIERVVQLSVGLGRFPGREALDGPGPRHGPAAGLVAPLLRLYRGLNAMTEPRMEPLPHIDAPLNEKRAACCQAASLISPKATIRCCCGCGSGRHDHQGGATW